MSKGLIFSDLHIGLRNDSISRINIVKMVVACIKKSIETHNIDTIFFLGDLFHTRSVLNVNTINIAYNTLCDLSKLVKNIYLIVGNHDIYYKTDTTVNSSNIFKNISGVHVIERATPIQYNGKEILLVPWLADVSSFKDETFDILMGHLDIPSNYILNSYFKRNSSSTAPSKDIINNILESGMIGNISDINLNDIDNTINIETDEFTNLVNKVKPNGVIYSGHIHKKDIFVTSGRKFIFVGAPYEQTLGDIGTNPGYILLDDNMNPKFVNISKILPTHYILRNSDIKKVGIDNFDFSILKNKIVKQIIDFQFDREDALKISNIISTIGVYEELPADYNLIGSISPDDNSNDEIGEMIKKSKVDYIKTYINSIESTTLKEKHIASDKLFELIETYINTLYEEKALI